MPHLPTALPGHTPTAACPRTLPVPELAQHHPRPCPVYEREAHAGPRTLALALFPHGQSAQTPTTHGEPRPTDRNTAERAARMGSAGRGPDARKVETEGKAPGVDAGAPGRPGSRLRMALETGWRARRADGHLESLPDRRSSRTQARRRRCGEGARSRVRGPGPGGLCGPAGRAGIWGSCVGSGGLLSQA